jgi:hypothetical protein
MREDTVVFDVPNIMFTEGALEHAKETSTTVRVEDRDYHVREIERLEGGYLRVTCTLYRPEIYATS